MYGYMICERGKERLLPLKQKIEAKKFAILVWIDFESASKYFDKNKQQLDGMEIIEISNEEELQRLESAMQSTGEYKRLGYQITHKKVK